MLYEIPHKSDSIFCANFNTSARFDNNIPNIKTGLLLNGKIDSFSFFIEPVISNASHRLANIGSEYSRNNISGRFENAFINYNFKNITLRLGRSSIWWGQSIHRSIIQSGLFPSYDHLLFQYKINNFRFDLLTGQLASRKLDDGTRIKRNIGGHRLLWKINKNL